MTWLPGFTSLYLHLLAFNVVIKGKVARGGRGGGVVVGRGEKEHRTIINTNRPTNEIILLVILNSRCWNQHTFLSFFF